MQLSQVMKTAPARTARSTTFSTAAQINWVPYLAVVFGRLLHRGRVANYGTIARQFLLKDFTLLKVMLTAIVVGGIGVFLLVQMGYAKFHIKESDLLAITLGAALFGVRMVQLPQLLRVDAPVIFVALGLFVIAFFVILERRRPKRD